MVSSMITNHLIKASIIEEKQRELYEYSIKSLFGNVLNIVSCLAIGVLCGECVRAIIFLLVMAQTTGRVPPVGAFLCLG